MPCLTWGHREPELEKPKEKSLSRPILSFFASPQMELLSRVTHQKYDLRPYGKAQFYALLKEHVESIWTAIQDKTQEEVAQQLVELAALCCQYYETHDDEPKINLASLFKDRL